MVLNCISDLFSDDQIIDLHVYFERYKLSNNINYNVKLINYCIYFLSDIKNKKKYLNDLSIYKSDKIKSVSGYCILLLKRNIDLTDVNFAEECKSIMPVSEVGLFKLLLDNHFNYRIQN